MIKRVKIICFFTLKISEKVRYELRKFFSFLVDFRFMAVVCIFHNHDLV